MTYNFRFYVDIRIARTMALRNIYDSMDGVENRDHLIETFLL